MNGIADNEARIVNVGVRKNQLINDAQFEAVSEHLRPYLAQLMTQPKRGRIKSARALKRLIECSRGKPGMQNW
jgi:hypothetical protein